MNLIEEKIIRAVAGDKVSRSTVLLAQRYLAQREAAANKSPVASVEHHRKVRRAEELEAEEVSDAVWSEVLRRSFIDHRHYACEACHLPAGFTSLEPHHLEMGAGGRRDAPEVVMALCASCHRTGDVAAHRTVRWFAQKIVIPWAQAHGYQLPNRKEYRE